MFPFKQINTLQQALFQGEISCVELVSLYLRQIEAHKDLNAFVEVWAEEALASAALLDQKLEKGRSQVGPLFGVVISLKDNICYAGHQVSAGAKILEGFTSLYSATAVERLLAADAILIGRTNCDQFGMGSSNENSVYGPVKNAADPERVPGGSSGGAAVAVQTHCCHIALGSDTGGSIRQPAGFCGVLGYKPAYGRISRHGLIAYGSSFDQIGIMAHDADDITLVLKQIYGPDDFDATALHTPLVPSARFNETRKKIAYFPQTMASESIDPVVQSVNQTFLKTLSAAGHEVQPLDFDLLDYVIPTYYVLTTAEASSNLARYDGIRYGYRSGQAENFEQLYLKSRTEGFSAEVKRRILLGTYVLSSGYYDAYYTKAQQARRLIRQRLLDILEEFDFIAMPVAPGIPWKFGEKSANPVEMYLSDIYTVMANLAGLPAIAFPAGKHPEKRLPIGMQLMSGTESELDLLAFAKKLCA